MKRVPIVGQALVALAIATMLALGWWQLFDRLPQKEAFLADLAANPARPPIAFPAVPDDRLLFRRAHADCRPPVAQRITGAGASGFRIIATCAGNHGVPGPIVQLGTTRDPMARVAWGGGAVSGFISHAPQGRPLIASLFDPRPQPLMLVADQAPAGLAANGRPDLDQVPNNHLAYAVQWFLFAAIAAIIDLLWLSRRWRGRAR